MTVWLAILLGTAVGVAVYALARAVRHKRRADRMAGPDAYEPRPGPDAGNHLVPDTRPEARALIRQTERVKRR